MEEMKSIHPYEAFIPDGANKLIIGTIPPFRFCTNDKKDLYASDVDFYYGSKDNYFWDIMSEITCQKLHYINSPEAIEERKEILRRHHTGITDIVKECIHKNGKSDDNSLLIDEKDPNALKPLNELLLKYPGIEQLIYTSKFVSKLVNRIADKHYHSWDKDNSKKGIVYINQRCYPVAILYSPSPSALRRVSKKDRLTQYKTVFGFDK